jgi:hypothetical protein
MNIIEPLSLKMIKIIYINLLRYGFVIWMWHNKIILWQNFGQCWVIEGDTLSKAD